VPTTDESRYGNRRGGSQLISAGDGVDWLPPVDILETPTSFEVALDVCGVPREAIDVRLQDGRLTVSGTRESADRDEFCHYRERQLGRFARAFTFRTPVNADGIEAKLADGVLTLTIPKQLPRKVALE
jgi:HSP20 family protein